MWLVEGLGDLGVHTAGSDAADLIIRVQLPALQAGLAVTAEPAKALTVGSPSPDEKRTPPVSSPVGSAASLAALKSSAASLASARGVRDARGVPASEVPLGSPAGVAFSPALRGSPTGSQFGRAGSMGSPTVFATPRQASPEAFATAPPRCGAPAVGEAASPPVVAAAVAAAGVPAAFGTGTRTSLQTLLEASPRSTAQESPAGTSAAAPLGSGNALPQASPATPQQSVAQQRARLEQRARAAFEMPGTGSSPGSELGTDDAERAAASPTNPFDDNGATVPPASASVNPFDERPSPAIAPAGATNAT